MNPTQLRELIGQVLMDLGLYSKDAVELLMLTAAQESHCGYYIKQLRGPARGIFQMEPATEKDIWENYLEYHKELAEIVTQLRVAYLYSSYDLWANLPYQIAMARIHYLRAPEKLPKHDDILGMAQYWKVYYNTVLGKGKVYEAVDNYKLYALRNQDTS